MSKYYNEPIDKHIPWDGNEKTDNKRVRGTRVEEFIKRTMNAKYGYSRLLGNIEQYFADVEDASLYDSDPDTYAELLLNSITLPEGGGAGSQYYVRVVNNLDNRVFASSIGDLCYIDFTFLSQFRENSDSPYEDTGERGYIKVYSRAKGSEYTLISEFYRDSNIPIRLEVSKYLVAGENDIKIEVTGEDSSQNAPALVYNITLTSLSLSAPNFQWWNVFTQDFIVPLIIGGNISKRLLVTVTGDDYLAEYNLNIGTHVYIDTAYNCNIPHPQKSGEYTITFRVENSTGTITTKELTFNVMCTTAEDTNKYVAINNINTNIKNWADNIMFDYACYDGSNAFTELIFDVYKDGEIISSNNNTNISTATNYTFNLPLEIETIDNENFDINVVIRDSEKTFLSLSFNVDNSLGYSATAGAILYINPKTRANTQDTKNLFINEMDGSTIQATWNNVSFGLDGWSADDKGDKSLHLIANSSVDVDYKIFALESSRTGKTVELDFKISNVANYGALAINMAQKNIGIEIYPDTVSVQSQSLKDKDLQSINFKDDDRIRMTITIMPDAYGNSGFNLCIIYINGVKNREFTYENNDYFQQEGILSIGCPYADVDIYGIRVYDFALSPAGVLLNMINWETDNDIREEIRAYNDILDADGVDVDYNKTRLKYNVFVFDGDIPSLKNPNEFKGNLSIEWAKNPEWNSKVLNVKCDGQGTSAKRYLLWNLRWKLKEDTVVQYSDGTTTTGSWKFVPHEVAIERATAKINWASSMQSHKMGSVNSISDLAEELGIKNEANARISVYQYPFVGFQKSINEEGVEVYTFLGLFTLGPDKGDENTFGYDEEKFPTLLSLEGSDNAPLPALFRVPWNPKSGLFAYNEDEEAFQYNETNCWDFNTGKLENIDKWIEAYNFVYTCSPRLLPFEGTLDDINSNVALYKDSPYEYWLQNGDVVYYETSLGLYTYSDIGEGTINLIEQLVDKGYGLTSDMLTGKTATETNELFIKARIQRFKLEMENYWDLQDAIFQRNWVEFNAATDNRAKNTYPYIFGEYADGYRWRWRSDDTDTIWPINNQGQSKKGYEVEVGDKYDNGQPVWNGETSNFWNLLDLAFGEEIIAGMKDMMSAMENLSGSNVGTSSDKIFAFFKKYYFDVAQEYFSETLYNSAAKKLYETAKIAYIKGEYTNDTDPITQSLGDHYSAERRWIKKRIPYMLSKYNYGDFSSSGTDSITVRAAGNIITYEITPAVWMYPTIINGTSVVRGTRTKPNEVCTIEVDLGGSADQQNTIQGASYLKDIGYWHDKNVTGPMIVKGKMLTELNIGHATEPIIISITSLTLANTPSLQSLVLSNVSTLIGTLDLTQCPRLEECYLDGTSVVQTLFYNGGNLQKVVFGSNNAYINFQNLPLLRSENVDISNCDSNITDFLVNNCQQLNPINLLYSIYSSQNEQTLKRIRCTGIAGTAPDEAIEMLFVMSKGSYFGLDSNGIALNTLPVFEGKLHVNKAMPMLVGVLKERFPQLEITYDTPLADPNISISYSGRTEFLENETIQLTATSSNQAYAEIDWAISNYNSFTSKEVSIDSQTGLLTFDVAQTNTTFTKYLTVRARSIYNRNAYKDIYLTIKGIKVDSVSITYGGYLIKYGDEATLGISILPVNNTKNANLLFATTNENLLTVDSNGKLNILSDTDFDAVRIDCRLDIDNKVNARLLLGVNDGVISSVDTNTAFMSVAVKNGWCKSEDEMLLSEAMNITTLPTSTFYSNSELLELHELKYFNITAFPSNMCSYCSNLLDFSYPLLLTNIGSSSFYKCESLKSVFIPKEIVVIGNSSFQSTGIENLIMEESEISLNISTTAFSRCNLSVLDFSKRPCSLGRESFGRLVNLESIHIPDTVTIEQNPFIGSAYKSITIDENSTKFYVEEGINALFSKDKTRVIFGGDGAYLLPETKYIDEFAFSESTLSDSFTFNENTYIYQYAFQYTVMNVFDFKNIKFVQTNVLNYIYAKEAIFYDTFTSNGLIFSVFTGWKNLEKVTFPVGITNSAFDRMFTSNEFNGCTNLKEIEIPSSLQTSKLGDSCFSGCASLESLFIPDSITEVGKSCFQNCGNINITGAKNVTTWGERCFAYSKIQQFTFPDATITIGQYAFYGCQNIKSVSFGTGIQNVGESFFANTPIESIFFPEKANIKTLPYAFARFCQNLENVVLPEGLTAIEHEAFYYCNKLQSINIPSTVTYMDYGIYGDCYAVKEIIIKSQEAPELSEWNVFGSGQSTAGYNNRFTGENIIYLPQNGTGYDSEHWTRELNNLQNYAGFTISYTL